MKWNDCIPVMIDEEMKNKLNAYSFYRLRNVRGNVWYDTKAKVCFGPQQDYFSTPKEYSFLAQPKQFTYSPLWGRPYVHKYFLPVFGNEYLLSTEWFCQNHPSLSKYQDKSVLIIGAGPSASEVDWKVHQTDFLWSCNHFFKHPELSKTKVDLFAIGNEVVTLPENKELDEYMKRFPETIACFETTNRKQDQLRDFVKRFPSQSMWAHTRYRSQIGAVPRLIVLAALMGCKEISFVGMDGLPKPEMPHVFEPGKKPQGSPVFAGAHDKFRRQYVVFWDYVLNTFKDVKFQNLGENTEGNLTADISRDRFPLEANK